MKTKAIAILTVVALAVTCVPANADPLPNQVLKFQQKPMDGTTILNSQGITTQYFGHDEISSAFLVPGTNLYEGQYMADDFADKFNTPVVHVTWWGSYPGTTADPVGVKKFAIVFESDVPADATNNFSHPGTVLLAQKVVSGLVTPGSGTFTETLVSGGGAPLNEALYKYNAELALPFLQQPDTVYWLKIVALIDDPANESRWGWHNRDYTVQDTLASALVLPGEKNQQTTGFPVWHFQDDAVTGTVMLQVDAAGGIPADGVAQTQFTPTHYLDIADGPIGIGQFSKDLAFELYTIPEPATLTLLALGGLAMLRRRKH
jgi:hypothetical protein